MNILEEIQNCPFEWKELGEVLNYEQPTKYIVSSKAYGDSNEIPVLTAGQSFILGYTNEKDGIYHASKNNPVIIFDDFTTSKQWVDFKFKVKSSAMKMLTIKDEFENEVLLRYVWHYLGTITYKPDQHGRQWIGTYSKFLVPIPPLEIQEKIVQILDKMTEYVTELTSELTSRKKQYSFYRDKLLSFEDEVYQVEWKELGEVVHSIKTGLNPRKFFQLNPTDATNYYITVREIRGHKIVPSEKTDLINNEGLILCQNRSNLESGDVLFTGTGTIGNVAIIEETPTNWNIKEGVYSIKPKKEIICSKFLMYIFESERVRKDIEGRKAGGTVKSISMAEMKKIKIPIPPLEIQEKIVQTLDKFDTVCNDLSIGLPKEIELCQKQYEYWRNQLLNFN